MIRLSASISESRAATCGYYYACEVGTG